MNVLDALNIFYREDVISDFLKNCFEDSPAFLQQFLHVAEIAVPTTSNFETINRLGLGKGTGTPDMIITARSAEENHIIILENKLGSGEGLDQTQRYESEVAQTLIKKRLHLDETTCTFHFVYLTLDPTVAPGSTNFTHVTYDVFLQNDWPLTDSTLVLIFRDFKEKLQQFYTPLQQPLETLSANLPLDSTQKKICWQALLFDAFDEMDSFTFEWGAFSGAGRSNFIFLLTKPNWMAQTPFQETGLASTFYVHLDVYINLLSSKNDGITEIGIRYETNPYVPHDKIAHVAGYDTYQTKRAVFVERLFQILSPQIPGVKRRNSKLLIMTVPVDSTDLASSVRDYKEKVGLIEQAIDAVFSRM